METQTQNETIIRLKCIEGHLQGIMRMVEEERSCLSILQQIRAVQGSLKQVRLLLLSQHLDVCLHDLWGKAPNDSQRQLHQELIDLFSA
jgi:DNA-binding FrmR family transcriptional regulator